MMPDMPRTCPGCGVPLQCQDPTELGFTPPARFDKEGSLCQRCFRLVHYGQLAKAPLQDWQVWNLIEEKARGCRGLLVFLDSLNLEVSAKVLKRAADLSLPVICVLTKADLLDRWIDRKDLVSRVRARWGIRDNVPVLALNLRDRKAVRSLGKDFAGRFGASSRILLVGGTNVGKTTFLKGYTASKLPTVSSLPGATLGSLEAVSRDGFVFVDTPGLLLDDPFLPFFCPDCLHALTASARITRRVFVLRPGQSLMWGGMAWLRVRSCGGRDWVKIIAFAPQEVTLHRTREGREEDLLETQSGNVVSPPCQSCLPTLESLGWEERLVELEKGMDLTLDNLGWLSVYQGELQGSLRGLRGLEPTVRPSLVPPLDRRPGQGHRKGKVSRRKTS